MRHFIVASLLCFSFAPMYGDYPAPNEPPPPKPEEQEQGEVAGPVNAYEYNLYDRMENRQDQERRREQQQYYYQSQNPTQNQNQYQNQNAPQFTRKKQPLHSQYFDTRNE